MLPGVSRVAYLGSKEDKEWESPWGQSVRTAAQTVGVTLVLTLLKVGVNYRLNWGGYGNGYR